MNNGMIQSLLPELNELPGFLQIESCEPNYGSVFAKMLDPLKEVLSVSGKKMRFEMVELGFKCSGETLTSRTQLQLEICEKIIEGIHLGSMIIDDIEDQSETRRGRPTFHRKYGVGVALNAGNWLYFQAIELIQSLGLDVEKELDVRRSLNQILLKAHFGQGIDVGINMNTLPQNDVEATYYAAAELKTGALMAFAFYLGATIGSMGSEYKAFVTHAKRFGIALQMLDDIGNYLAPPPKGKEDLIIGRPSFIWSMAAKLANPSDYERFKFATRMLPDSSFIDSWNGIHGLIPHAKEVASEYLRKARVELIELLIDSSSKKRVQNYSLEDLKNQIESLFKKLEKAYE